jgi:hypothetical protein
MLLLLCPHKINHNLYFTLILTSHMQLCKQTLTSNKDVRKRDSKLKITTCPSDLQGTLLQKNNVKTQKILFACDSQN